MGDALKGAMERLENGSIKWKPNKYNYGHSQLVRTGRLRDSIKAIKDGKTSVKVVATAPYAKYVNDKRRFMGESAELKRQLQKEIERAIAAAFA